MPVYMIVEATEVTDKKKYSEYIKKVPPTIEKFGGTYLARGGAVTVVAGDWNHSFEDSFFGLQSAKGAGIFTIGILNRGWNDDFVYQLSDFVIDDYNKLII